MKQLDVIALTGQSKNTLNNWQKNKPALFSVVSEGCKKLFVNHITKSDFLPFEDSLSKTSKMIGLSPNDIILATGQSRQTLSNWQKNKPALFLVVLVGVKKHFNKNDFQYFINFPKFNPLVLTGERLENISTWETEKPKLFEVISKGCQTLSEFKYSYQEDIILKSPSTILNILDLKYSELLDVTMESRSNLNYWCSSKPCLFLAILVGVLTNKMVVSEENFNIFFKEIVLKK